MRLKAKLLASVLFLLPAGAAMAQPGPGYGWQQPVYQPQAPVVVRPNPAPVEHWRDRDELRDDVRDLRRLESVAARFDSARWANNFGELFRIEGELRVLVRRELAESRREIRDDRREVYEDNGWPMRPGEWRPSYGRRDDIRDYRAERFSMIRRHEIARQLDFLWGRMDWNALNQKRQLIGELITLAHQEVREDWQEVREDRWDDRHDRWDRRDRRRGRDYYR
jgi:hypothetical protein